MSPSCPLGISLFVFADLHRSEYLVSVGDGVDGDIKPKKTQTGLVGLLCNFFRASRGSRKSFLILDEANSLRNIINPLLTKLVQSR